MKMSVPQTLRKSDYPINVMHNIGFFDLVRKSMPEFLTVLNYHRIDDPTKEGFDTFRPNISATPNEFAKQMEYVCQNYNVISGEELVLFIKGGRPLPKHALLITFDDGYLDNFVNAYPVLKARGLPAIIFVATDYIGSEKPFFWDFVAYCFHYTTKDHANLPGFGPSSWSSKEMQDQVMREWIETLKKIPEHEKQKAIMRLPQILDVSIADHAFANTMISWSHAREMCENGIEIGGHTASHPILTRISLDDVVLEVTRSKRRIEEELRKPVKNFAYPNGQYPDINREISVRLQKAGYESGFTLISGPTHFKTVSRQPYAIRRIFLSHEDSFPRFVAKLVGIPRIFSRW